MQLHSPWELVGVAYPNTGPCPLAPSGSQTKSVAITQSVRIIPSFPEAHGCLHPIRHIGRNQILRVELSSSGGDGPYKTAAIESGTADRGPGALVTTLVTMSTVGAAVLEVAMAFEWLLTVFLQQS